MEGGFEMTVLDGLEEMDTFTWKGWTPSHAKVAQPLPDFTVVEFVFGKGGQGIKQCRTRI